MTIDVLQGLDPEQREAVELVRGPVCILAGAGTGKTRAVMHRIAYAVHSGAVPAEHVLAVTFTQRAAGEMRTRLRSLGVPGVQARTFHSAALRQLSHFWPRALGGEIPPLVDSKVRLVAEAAGRLRLSPDRAALRDLTGEIEWSKSTLTTPEAYPDAALRLGRAGAGGLDPVQVGRLYEEYERARRRAEVLDFEEILLLLAGIITDRPDIAAEVRARYRHFTVDEYQDVTPLQQQVLDCWLGGRDDLCVVGDPAQTIYSFTGATPRWLQEFPRRFPAARVVRLVRDYRSTPQVVELANAVIRADPSVGGVQLVAQRPPGPAPVWRQCPDEPSEATAVATAITELRAEGVPASEIAVLFRINAQSESHEQALGAAGIPFVVRGGERFFNRPEIRQAIVLLRGAARAAGGQGALTAEVRGTLSGIFDADRPPPVTSRAQREAWDALSALVALAADSDASDLAGFVAEIEERAQAAHVPTVEGVTLASLHAAKGLEWDAVFLVGCTDGTLPLIHAESEEAIAEERRLLYVGVTRAREHLSISWSLARSPGGRGTRRLSRFLLPLQPGGQTVAASATRARAKKRDAKAPLPHDVDPELFERLRTWRRERAGELKQPAYCVFTDATLEAIAARRPVQIGQLRGLPGVGATKLEKFGPEVVEICAAEVPA
jgi:DNA helicase-2/ATP-dependent DNA helicase PcrA